MNCSDAQPESLLCVGMGWSPLTPGGLNRYVYELTHQLAAAGDRIELCGVGLPPAADTPVQLTPLAQPDSRLPRRLWDVYQNFDPQSRPSAINLHFALYGWPLLPKLPAGVPVTFTFHGPWALESQWEGDSPRTVRFKRWLEQQVYSRCDRFIVLSQAFGTILHNTYGVPWHKIHIIPGGVNTDLFRPTLTPAAARAQLGWHPNRQILFTPRRLVQRMGLDHLIAAIAQIRPQVPDLWLAIAGKGPMRADLEQQVRAAGLEEAVHFLGFLPDAQLPIAYQAADLTIVPSQSLEGFGLILLESLACGTPVLSTPVGGMPEVLAPFWPALVTPNATTDAIAARLVELLTGKIALPDRAACREYAVQRFDWQTIAQQVRQVLLAPV